MSEHPSYHGRLSHAATAATERPVTSESGAVPPTSRRHADRACCCLAQPAVIAVMPPRGERQAETDLLLCGHHYRFSKAALAAADARILDMTGHLLERGDWPGDSR